ncbi:MAG TPA: tetratricopeptide repeat protein [Phycisphaerae bacterium]|nr:tetratricopeptide repeat protein [Phycisphaerae bacterium]
MNSKKLLACFMSVFLISAYGSLRSITYAQDAGDLGGQSFDGDNIPVGPEGPSEEPSTPPSEPDDNGDDNNTDNNNTDNNNNNSNNNHNYINNGNNNNNNNNNNDNDNTPTISVSDSYNNQGIAYFNNKDYVSAYNDFFAAMQSDPDTPLYRWNAAKAAWGQALAAFNSQDWAGAINLYQNALALFYDDPTDFTLVVESIGCAQSGLGGDLYKNGDCAGALYMFQSALAYDTRPENKLAYQDNIADAENGLGTNAWKNQDWAGAIDYYQKALSESSGDPSDSDKAIFQSNLIQAQEAAHPNTVWDASGAANPVDGYQWTNPNSTNDLTVEPIPAGTPNSEHPNTVWNGSAQFHPADGYEWTNNSDPSATSFGVQPYPAGTPDADHANTVWDGSAHLTPADGYQWAVANGPADNDFTVKPLLAGTPDAALPNVVWSGNAQLLPAPGYQWVSNNNQNDDSVSLIPTGTPDSDHANTVWDGSAKLVPAPGYQWVNANGASDDFNVQPIPADTIDSAHPATVWDGNGNIIPAPGYQWADANGPADNNFAVNPIPAGTPDADHPNTFWDGSGILTPASGYQWDSSIDPNDDSVVPITAGNTSSSPPGANPIELTQAYQQAEDLVHNFRLQVQAPDDTPVVPDPQTSAVNPPPDDANSIPPVDSDTAIADLSDPDWDPSFSDDPDQSVPLPPDSSASSPPPANTPAPVESPPVDSAALQTQVNQQIARFQNQLAGLKKTQKAWQTALKKLQSGQNYQAELDDLCKEGQDAQLHALAACLDLLVGEAGPAEHFMELHESNMSSEQMEKLADAAALKMKDLGALLAEFQTDNAPQVLTAIAEVQNAENILSSAMQHEGSLVNLYKNMKTISDGLTKAIDAIGLIDDTHMNEKQNLLLAMQNVQDFIANQVINNPTVQDFVREQVNDVSLGVWQKEAAAKGMQDVATYASLGKFAINYGYESARFYMAWNGVNETLGKIDDQNRIAGDMQYKIVQSTNQINQVKAQLAALQAASGNDQQSRQVLDKIQQQDRIQAYEAALMLPENSMPAAQ